MKVFMPKEEAKELIKFQQQICRYACEINGKGKVQTVKDIEKFKQGIDKLDALYYDFEKNTSKLKSNPEIVDGHIFLARVSQALELIIAIAHFGNIVELEDFNFDESVINRFVDKGLVL